MHKKLRRLHTTLLTTAATVWLSTAAMAQTSTEVVVAPIVAGPNSATTTGAYSGETWVCTRGTGRAADTKMSDSFFVYTTSTGTVLPPPGVLGTNEPHPWHSPLQFNWALWINTQTADHLIVPGKVPTIPGSTVPVYNPTHLYAFPITAPGGVLTFGVGDTLTSDNSGAYVITLGTRSQALGCYLDEVVHRTALGYVWGDILLPDSTLFARLANADRYILQGNDAGARAELEAAVKIIQAEKGKLIEAVFASELLTAIQYFMGLLG